MLDNTFYNGLLKDIKGNNQKMQDYITEEKQLLGKKKELLEAKESELEAIKNYLLLTTSVVETLRQDISIKVEQLKLAESLILSGENVGKAIDNDLTKLSSVSPVVLDKNSKEFDDIKNLNLESINHVLDKSVAKSDIVLSTLSEVKKESDLLVNDSDDNLFMVNDEQNEVEKDIEYIKLAMKKCRLPVDETKIDIWKRRVLVKHYMEQGLSTVQSVVERYNKYASHEQISLATKSSISKDMRSIFEGLFTLDIITYDKELQSNFRASSMLTSDEICQINKIINQSGDNKKDVMESVLTFAFSNLNDMSIYKKEAVKSFVNEQVY